MILLFLTVMMGFTVSGLVGFGGNVLAMPILSMVFSMKDIVLAFAAVSFVNSTGRFIQYRKNIVWRRFIPLCVFMFSGSAVGMIIYRMLPENELKLILGIFIILMAIYNTVCKETVILKPDEGKETKAECIFYHVILLLGGLMQGAFVCGGPLLVIFCNRYFGYKRDFFMGMEWGLVFLNSIIIMANNLVSDSYHGEVIVMSVVGIFALVGAFILSGWLSKRISDRGLHKGINIVLLISGISISVQAAMKLFG
jgi:hypothetical protein